MKKGLKIPNSVKKVSSSKDISEKEKSQPSTAEEWLEQGSFEEECGDRWLGSDLNKSLRFYQKAFECYWRSLELNSTDNLDAYYNSSRLLFHVYNQYTKAEGVKISDMTQIDDVFKSEDTSVVQDLVRVVYAHERSIEAARSNGDPPLDLLFNTALIYTEVVEREIENDQSNFVSVLEKGRIAQQLFGEILQRQERELERFLSDLSQINEPSHTDAEDKRTDDLGNAEVKEENYITEEVLQPTDIFETVIEVYVLSQAILENIDDFDSQIVACMDNLNPVLSVCDEYAEKLTANFGQHNNNQREFVSSISQTQEEEYMILKHIIVGLGLNNADDLISHWRSENLPDSHRRYLAAADNLQTFLDRNDVDTNTTNSNVDIAQIQWKVLSVMSTFYKAAQDKLTQQLNEKRKMPSGEVEGIGTLLANISEIMIARSDIDVRRGLIDNIEAATKSKAVLVQNSKTLLKSAMNLANSTGGLRERASEKLQREQRKTESVLRMCVLEGRNSIEELDSILGRKRWVEELPNLKKLEFYDHVGTANICLPE